MKTKLISLTQLSEEMKQELPEDLQSPEGLMAYTARVSSPKQDNPSYEGLLKYCIKHNHWSIFEMIDMTIEIETSRAIAQQILRHKSFSFQEFSQRYAQANLGVEVYEARSQDLKNRQNSNDDMTREDKDWFLAAQNTLNDLAQDLYSQALNKNIAKEQARFLLPLSTTTRLYMKGSIRSWIHFLEIRTDPTTQKEHRDVANSCKDIFTQQFPIISKALNWTI